MKFPWQRRKHELRFIRVGEGKWMVEGTDIGTMIALLRELGVIDKSYPGEDARVVVKARDAS